MTYKHIAVTDIVKHTADKIAQLNGQINTVHPNLNNMLMVDGLPCIRELAQLAAAIRKANRYVKFGIARDAKYIWSLDTYTDLLVYMDGDTYAMARIGYSDYSVAAWDTSRKFMVASRTIKNEKYREDRKEYHMVMTDTLDRAVKNVSKHMRRYSPLEVATISYETIRHKLRSPTVNANALAFDTRQEVLKHPQLKTELFHLLDMGYSFLSAELQGMVINWRNAYKELIEAMSMAKPCYFVTVRLQSDDMLCDVVRLHSYEDIKDGTDPAVVYKMDELPEELAGKIAVLSMVEDDHYVNSIGLRVNSSTFWVHT